MNVMHLKVIVFSGDLIVLQCFVHVQSQFQPLPTKLVFGYFDRGSYNLVAMASILTLSLIPPLCLPGL